MPLRILPPGEMRKLRLSQPKVSFEKAYKQTQAILAASRGMTFEEPNEDPASEVEEVKKAPTEGPGTEK